MTEWYANEDGEMVEATVLIDDLPHGEAEPFAPAPDTHDDEYPW